MYFKTIATFVISIFLLFLILTFDKYPKNKKVYNLKIGEELLLYGTTNSCCCYTLCNPSDLKHLQHLGDKIVKTYGECAGCNYTEAEKFKALSAGKDTIIFAITAACADCDQNELGNEKYIINILEK